jgi:hypothetical protein
MSVLCQASVDLVVDGQGQLGLSKNPVLEALVGVRADGIISGHAKFVNASSGRRGSTRSVAVNIAGKPTTNEAVARRDGNWLHCKEDAAQRKEGKLSALMISIRS